MSLPGLKNNNVARSEFSSPFLWMDSRTLFPPPLPRLPWPMSLDMKDACTATRAEVITGSNMHICKQPQENTFNWVKPATPLELIGRMGKFDIQGGGQDIPFDCIYRDGSFLACTVRRS